MKKNVKKLVVGKETIRSLAQNDLTAIAGGVAPTHNAQCAASNVATCLQAGCISGHV